MISHVWSVLAAKSVIDGDTQLVSIYDIADTLNIEGRITKEDGENQTVDAINVPVQSEVVSMFYKTSEKNENGEIKLELQDPKGQKLSDFTQKIELTKPFLRTRIKLTSMTVNKTGIYKVRVSLREKTDEVFRPVAEIPYMVNVDIK